MDHAKEFVNAKETLKRSSIHKERRLREPKGKVNKHHKHDNRERDRQDNMRGYMKKKMLPCPFNYTPLTALMTYIMMWV